jgi:hypothetical protein
VLPLDGWRDTAGPGFGGAVRLAVPLGGALTVTARVGAVAHLPATTTLPGVGATTTETLAFPLLGGARYAVSEPGWARGYFFGDVGVVFRRTDVAIGGLRDSDTDIVFASLLGAGVQLGRWDVTAAVWLADLADLDDAIGVRAAVGVDLLAP